ncbi:hypothetical protein V8C26DRAFT_124378 [Trichoderma gracile]
MTDLSAGTKQYLAVTSGQRRPVALYQRSESPHRYPAGSVSPSGLSLLVRVRPCRAFFSRLDARFPLSVAHSFLTPAAGAQRWNRKQLPTDAGNHQTHPRHRIFPRACQPATLQPASCNLCTPRYCERRGEGRLRRRPRYRQTARYLERQCTSWSSFGKRSPFRPACPPLSCSCGGEGLKTAFRSRVQALLIQELVVFYSCPSPLLPFLILRIFPLPKMMLKNESPLPKLDGEIIGHEAC